MTDNHSTDQNNNNNKKNVTDKSDEKIENYENGITESMHNGKSRRKWRIRVKSLFLAYGKLRDSASSASNGLKRRKKLV